MDSLFLRRLAGQDDRMAASGGKPGSSTMHVWRAMSVHD